MDYKKFLNLIISNKKDLQVNISLLKVGKKEIQKGVFLGKNVDIEPYVFFDVSGGEIVIDDNTKVRSNSVLRGPIIIGKNSKINSFAEITCSQIGDVCKVGGEFYESIMQSYSNKPHAGFVGHSYIGSWVNIGGGTNISTLKNTYGKIKMGGVDTGETNLGAVIGNYAKTAVNTSIFPGKIICEGAHIYGTVSEDVPAFTSHVSARNLYEVPTDVTIKMLQAMMLRREVQFTKEDEDKIKKLYEETETDREKAGVKKEKLKF